MARAEHARRHERADESRCPRSWRRKPRMPPRELGTTPTVVVTFAVSADAPVAKQGRKSDEGPTAGDAVGDARADAGEQIDRESPPQWNGGDDHCRSLLKVKSLRTRTA